MEFEVPLIDLNVYCIFAVMVWLPCSSVLIAIFKPTDFLQLLGIMFACFVFFFHEFLHDIKISKYAANTVFWD